MNSVFDGFYAESYRLLAGRKGVVGAGLDDALAQHLWEAHLRNPTDERHLEFLSTAVLDVFVPILGAPLEPGLHSLLERIVVLFGSDHPAANWRLMRRIARCALAQRALGGEDLEAVQLLRDSDGLLRDVPGERSTQYHAYLLLLILRFAAPTPELRKRMQAAFDWLVEVSRRFGDPSPLGRGRFQLFGYAAMAAAIHHSENWDIRIDATWKARVFDRVKPELPDGSLVADWAGPHRTALMHGYNTTQDYRAFAAFWLKGRALLNQLHEPIAGLWWHPLDSHGHGLIANVGGVQAALLPHETLGVEAEGGLRGGLIGVRDACRVLIERCCARWRPAVPCGEPLPIGPGFLHACGASALRYDGTAFHFSIDAPGSESIRFLQSPTLWLPNEGRFVRWQIEGSLESESLTWMRSGLSAWVGRRVRIVRKGHLECQFVVSSES